LESNLSNKKKYNESFVEIFSINEDLLEELEYNSIPQWDSVGHMALIALLEENFEIMMDMEEIIDFSSYKKGLEILRGYNIAF
tara:strand:+ start:104 stop:352 length:249 start_codon:yes stop_codon:yes gene_type:complete